MNIGIYQSYWGRVGGGQRYVAVAAQVLAQQHSVEIVHHCEGFDPATVEEPLEVDLARVRFRYVPRPERPQWPTRNPLARLRLERSWQSSLSSPYDLYLDSSDAPPYFCHAPRGVLLIHFPLISFEQFHAHTGEAWSSRPALLRWGLQRLHRYEWRQRLASYQGFLVNSHYTRGWLQRRWGVDAQVLYPPMRSHFSPAVKEPLILSIGAFHRAEHKKHEVLLRVFRELCDAGLQGWRYLQVGALGQSDEDHAYVEQLRQVAEGYPIELRTNVSGAELKSLLERATLLWHSMGYGVDPQQHPELLEHFGMVVTEAMAAGCLPIVFRGGGLCEIVSDGRDGLLWETLTELKEATGRLVADPGLRQQMAEHAQQRSADFDDTVFRRRLVELLSPWLSSCD